jgi:hypothetical protein
VLTVLMVQKELAVLVPTVRRGLEVQVPRVRTCTSSTSSTSARVS